MVGVNQSRYLCSWRPYACFLLASTIRILKIRNRTKVPGNKKKNTQDKQKKKKDDEQFDWITIIVGGCASRNEPTNDYSCYDRRNNRNDRRYQCTIEQDEPTTRDRDASDPQQEEELTLEGKLRKYTCAAGGGALVVLGVILTPIPLVPLGLPTIVAGLHVLGHEFEEAKVAEQRVWDTIQDGYTHARVRIEVVNEQINKQWGIPNPKEQPQVVPTILSAVEQQPKVRAQMVSV